MTKFIPLHFIGFVDEGHKDKNGIHASDEAAQKQLGHTSKRMTLHYIRKDRLLKPTDEIT